jgi:hypothetical protein
MPHICGENDFEQLFSFPKVGEKQVVNGFLRDPRVFPLENKRQLGTISRGQCHEIQNAFSIHLTAAISHQDAAFEFGTGFHKLRRGPQVQPQTIHHFYFFRNGHHFFPFRFNADARQLDSEDE